MVAKGSLVRVDYEAWTEDGALFDTTKRDVAKEADAYEESVVYEPLPILVGAGRVVPGFDEALEGADVGNETEIEIPPEKAFGPHDPAKTDVVPMREFQKEEVTPYPGMRLQIKGKTATITSVSAGRVRIDYNPPHAGKALRYKFTVTELLENPEDKIKAVIEMAYGQGRASDFAIDVKDDTAEITLPDSCKYDQRWFVAKYRIVSDLRTYAGIDTTRFIEEYHTEKESEAPAGEAASTEATEAPSEEAAPDQS